MSDPRPILTARRRVEREDRLGKGAFCLFFGYACLEALTQVSRDWLEKRGVAPERLNRLLEEHHIFGQQHDPEALITLCLNCHREITEGIAAEGVSMRPEKNLRKLIARAFRGLAVTHDFLARSCRRWARLVEDLEL